MVRIHADGSADRSLHGVSTLVPGLAPRLDRRHLHAEPRRRPRDPEGASSARPGAADRGIVRRSDLTGFNWANVPAVLVETGFLSNPTEARRLTAAAYQQRVATGLANGVGAFMLPIVALSSSL